MAVVVAVTISILAASEMKTVKKSLHDGQGQGWARPWATTTGVGNSELNTRLQGFLSEPNTTNQLMT